MVRGSGQRCLVALALVTFGAGCTLDNTPGGDALPMGGKADAVERSVADRGCSIVLREARPVTGIRASYCIDAGCFTEIEGSVDLARIPEGGLDRGGVLYRLATNSEFSEIPIERVGLSPDNEWFDRFRFAIAIPVSDDGQDGAISSLELIPFYSDKNGVRRFDHNRLPSDLDNYVLDSEHGFAVDHDGAVCGQGANRATARFLAGYEEELEGELVPQGELEITYELDRLPSCRGTHNGYPAWDIAAHVDFLPHGAYATGTVREFETLYGSPQNRAHAVPFRVRVPAGTESVHIWFENTTLGGAGCRQVDTNYDANYTLSVSEYAALTPEP